MTSTEIVEARPFQLLSELEGAGMLTTQGLFITDPDLSRERYEAIGRMLGRVGDSYQWAVGDWILAGEQLYGEDAYQLQEAAGLSEDTRQRYVRVAQMVPPERRVPGLSWSHHRLVVSLEPERQTEMLQVALQSSLSKHDLRERLAELRETQERVFRVNPRQLENAARAVVRDAQHQPGGTWLVTAESYAQLEAALGGD